MTLVEFKIANGLSLKALSLLLGFPVSTVCGWLAGVRQVDPGLILRVSAATCGAVTPHELRPDLASIFVTPLSRLGHCAKIGPGIVADAAEPRGSRGPPDHAA